MQIESNKSLEHLHTFRMPVPCQYFIAFDHLQDLQQFLKERPAEMDPLMVIGEGSNMLFTQPVRGTVIRLMTRGIDLVGETADEVVIRVAAGENWDRVVAYCVDQGWGGLENLSLIPGLTGAAPIQNIGAYGTEFKDVCVSVETVLKSNGTFRSFDRDACGFGYRNSIFKDQLRGQVIVTGVVLKLQKSPQVSTHYGSLNHHLREKGIEHPTIRDVREAVCEIRRMKLPDPELIASAGSFFKNPVIRADQFNRLKSRFPDISYFPDPDGVKVAAAWLIEHCGWKGTREGDAGVHPDQPLVLVNYGSADGEQILDLATRIRESVLSRFDIMLEPEVNII